MIMIFISIAMARPYTITCHNYIGFFKQDHFSSRLMIFILFNHKLSPNKNSLCMSKNIYIRSKRH